MTDLDAAYTIPESAGQSLRPDELTQGASKLKLILPLGQTPEATMASSLVLAAKRPLFIALVFLIVSMLAPPTAFADPALPLSQLPICGDQDGSDPPFSFRCADFVHYPDAQTYRVQGSGVVTFKADFVYRQAGYNNELGFFIDPNELVDPFGWRDQCVNAVTDPWPIGFKKDDGTAISGAKSKGLWKFGEPTCAQFVANKGHAFTTSDGVVVSVPDKALPAAATLAYNTAPEPPGAGASATAARAAENLAVTTISLDRTFQLSGVYGNGTAVTGFAVPVLLSVPYSETDLAYLDENTFTIYHWNDAGASWEALGTAVDQQGNRASASTDTTGTFSLRAQPTHPAPVIGRVVPSSARTGSETVLHIEGANFLLTPAVNLGMGGLEPRMISSSVLTATVPAGLPPGQYDLMVHNPDGQTAVLGKAVTVGERLYLPYILR